MYLFVCCSIVNLVCVSVRSWRFISPYAFSELLWPFRCLQLTPDRLQRLLNDTPVDGRVLVACALAAVQFLADDLFDDLVRHPLHPL